MQAGARFGRGVYLSGSQATPKRRRPRRTLWFASKEQRVQRRLLDLSHPSTNQLRAFATGRDLRGAVKHDVIGSKIGHKIGSQAGNAGRIIRYQSARTPNGSNYFIPKSLYEKHPRIIRDVKANATWHR